jgi:pentalenene oxygenase
VTSTYPPASVGYAPGRLPLLGHAWSLLTRPLEFIRAQRSLGDIVEFRIGPKRAYLVNDPELVHQMLVSRRSDFVRGGPLFEQVGVLEGVSIGNTDGELHLRQRRMIQPAFHPTRLPTYAAIMSEVANTTAESWYDGQTVRVDRAMYQHSTTVMARCLYSGRLSAEAIEEIIRSMPIAVSGIGLRSALPLPWLHALPTPGNRRFTQALKRLHTMTDRMISDRRASVNDHDDALSIMMSARDKDTGEPMTDQQIHDEFLTLILGASETTAHTMAWALHLLGSRPDIEARLHAELDDVLGDRPISFDDLPQLTYLRATVSETLRMYPAAWLIPRSAATDTHLGGHPLRSGAYVFFSPYANHHDPALFPDPETFDPDRWLPDQAKPVRCAHIPFSAGAHKCIGDTFAVTEVMITIATIVSAWRLRPDGRPVRPRPLATLSTGPLTMIAKRWQRSQAA